MGVAPAMNKNDDPAPGPEVPSTTGKEAKIWLWAGAILLCASVLLITVKLLAERHLARKRVAANVQLMMMELQQAIGYFRAEYGRWPVGEVEFHPSGAGMLVHLTGADTRINKRGIGFVKNLRPACGKPPVHGLRRDGESAEVLDLWGRHFLVVLDHDLDGQISNPEGPASGSKLNLQVGVISAGPDGVLTGKNREGEDATRDNLRTW